jgi:predicted kinase
MRQFDPEALFSTGLERGTLSGEHVDALAERIAEFPAGLGSVVPSSDAANRDPADETVRKNVREIFALAPPSPLRARIEALAGWIEGELARVGPAIAARRRMGFVRECHGDLHLANVALVDDRPVLFDCLEFDLALRCIDVVDEIAFAFMDFRAHGRPDLAARFVNAYLERTGDYEGVVGLRLFAVHRALVRAKVALIRAGQPDGGHAPDGRARSGAASVLDSAVERPLAVAEGLARSGRPRLVITCGLAGSGKTTVSSRLVEGLEAIRVRSDVERKRMAGLAAAERSGSGLGEGLYDPEASRRTYARLESLAEQMLASGWSVVVDAAFLTARERAPFRALARRGGFAFSTIVCDAPVEVLRRRIEARGAAGRDASEADRTVLDRQLTIHEPPTADERAESITLSTDAPLEEVEAACAALAEQLRASA